MKTIYSIIMMLFIITLSPAYSQWTRLPVLAKCTPTSIIRTSDKIICGTPAGLYFSTDSGTTWNDFTTFPSRNILAMENSSDTIIIFFSTGVYEEGIDNLFATTSFDDGVSWSMPYYLSPAPLAYLHRYGNQLIANVNQQLIISYDFGISWMNVRFPAGEHFYAAGFFNHMYIFQTSDSLSNRNWYRAFGGDTIYQRIDSVINNTVFAIDSLLFTYINNPSNTISILRSDDYGLTWQAIITISQPIGFFMDVVDNNLYYSNGSFYFLSTDKGNSWQHETKLHFLDFENILPLSNGDEICKRYDVQELVHYVAATDTFYSINNIYGNDVYSFINSNNNLYALDLYKGIEKSTDCGNSFNIIWPYNVYHLITKGDTLIHYGYSLLRSFDGGQTWDSAQAITQGFIKIVIAGNRLYSNWPSLTYSDDFGDSWLPLPTPVIQSSCGTATPSDRFVAFGNDLYTLTDSGVVCRFDHVTQTWSAPFCFPIDQGYFLRLTIQATENQLIIVSDTDMYISSDGLNWNTCQLNGLPLGISHRVLPDNLIGNNFEILGTFGKHGIYYSTDSGNNWQPLLPTPPFIPTMLAKCNDELFAASYFRGIWKSGIFLGTEENYESAIHNIIPFPNPVRNNFHVKLPQDFNEGKILIRNVFGEILIEQPVNSPDAEINCEILSSGIYYGQLINQRSIKGIFTVAVMK